MEEEEGAGRDGALALESSVSSSSDPLRSFVSFSAAPALLLHFPSSNGFGIGMVLPVPLPATTRA
jgi:hypothetical protein